MDVERIAVVGAELGEGPAWFDDALWFVDIKQCRIHRHVPGQAKLASWRVSAQVGWILPAAGGGIVAGLKTGLHRFEPDTGAVAPLLDPEPHRPGNRLNDATVDCRGTLWFGSMDDAEAQKTGALYRCDAHGCVMTELAPVEITNGPACNADGTVLYHTDTLGRRIWRVPVNDDFSLGVPTLFAEIEDGAGYPDGPVVDAEGCLWTGLFGGWAVRRYDPAGRLMRQVRFPVANVTKIAFGGPELSKAFATTARKGLTGAALADQPFAGDLFAFDPGVAGLPIGHIRMPAAWRP